ncbi:hypothetical protein PhCBS80983_g01387 [Powellomyces hirtus]|uniref:Asteroid domain-containing protein n=1 Tax=Powellomyces hirtus TaxID=109895 RepID=A0A507EB99_9FUNG|nr:hypothetical protein PhCBS80983_g01387 [Powellomyces hirtus]
MGVTGLASYVRQLSRSPAIPVTWPLLGTLPSPEESTLVLVDGNSFVHYIARKVSWLHGAQHDLLCEVLLREVDKFRSVGLEPQFIFDGILPELKREERKGRLKERIDRVQLVMDEIMLTAGAPSMLAQKGSASFLPPMIMPACIHALRSAGVNVAVYPHGEADMALAQQARRDNAPIISLDSDFFIHTIEPPPSTEPHTPPLLTGYIPIDTLSWSEGGLHAQIYKRADTSKSLGINPILLPVLAALGGCDYISSVNQALAGHLSLLNPKLRGFMRITKVIQILQSLNHLTSAYDAVDAVIAPLNPGALKDDLRNSLKLVVAQYSEGVQGDSEATSTILNLVRNGMYEFRLAEVATQRIFWCSPYLENVARRSVWEVSRPLRRWIYGIIAWSCQPPDNDRLWGVFPIDRQLWTDYQSGSLQIKEYLRRAERLVSENVEPVPFAEFHSFVQSALGPDRSRTSDKFLDASVAVRRTIYFRVLTADGPRMRTLDPFLIPLAISVRYLIQDLFSRDQPIANYEIIAIICAGVISLEKRTRAQPGSELQENASSCRPTRDSLHRLAQMETVLYCNMLLAQSLLIGQQAEPAPQGDVGGIEQDTNWGCLDGLEFHRCMVMAKGGAAYQRMLNVGGCDGTVNEQQLTAGRITTYLAIYAAATDGIEEQMEAVMSYGPSGTGLARKKKRTTLRKTPMTRPRPAAAPSNNMFDVLSSGCNF